VRTADTVACTDAFVVYTASVVASIVACSLDLVVAYLRCSFLLLLLLLLLLLKICFYYC